MNKLTLAKRKLQHAHKNNAKLMSAKVALQCSKVVTSDTYIYKRNIIYALLFSFLQSTTFEDTLPSKQWFPLVIVFSDANFVCKYFELCSVEINFNDIQKSINPCWPSHSTKADMCRNVLLLVNIISKDHYTQ